MLVEFRGFDHRSEQQTKEVKMPYELWTAILRDLKLPDGEHTPTYQWSTAECSKFIALLEPLRPGHEALEGILKVMQEVVEKRWFMRVW